MHTENARIGCIIMASGLSSRYGRNKLLEKLDGREVILHTADRLRGAGLEPLAVTRSPEVRVLLDGEGIRCVLHDGEKKSDTIHTGLRNLEPDVSGILFMPGDQPLVLPSSIRKMTEQFARCPERPVRLGSGEIPGSPVLFPAAFREALLAYTGDRGGLEVLKQQNAPCDVVQAAFAWELLDVDTPAGMEQVRGIYREIRDLL